MVAVVMMSVIVVVVDVVKAMVWDAAVIDMVAVVEVFVIDARADVAIDMFVGVEIIGVAAVMITLEFAVSISYFVDVLSDMVVGALIEVVAEIIMGFVSDIGVEVLNVNTFAFLTAALEFGVPKPL